MNDVVSIGEPCPNCGGYMADVMSEHTGCCSSCGQPAYSFMDVDIVYWTWNTDDRCTCSINSDEISGYYDLVDFYDNGFHIEKDYNEIE